MKNILSIIFCLNLLVLNAQIEERAPKGFNTSFEYRQNPNLSLYFYYPDSFQKNESLPALVLFFGGGWRTGAPKAFENQAKYLKSRGLIVILADYRTSSLFGTTPEEAVKDAKSVMRYVRENANKLHVIPNMIAAGGGSAGGHLAAACATIENYNNVADNLKISPHPNALVLFNPVINNGPANYGFDRLEKTYKEISPYHNLKAGVPPTIIMQGTKDNLIPVETMKLYKLRMDSLGIRCDLHLYEGQKHGFFNISNKEYYDKTLLETDNFLVSIGYLHENKSIKN